MDVITVDTVDHHLTAPPDTQDPAGPVHVEVRPDLRRLHVVAGDILAALGKRRDIAGKGRNEHDDIAHAQAWLHAHHTPDLVVAHTQRLRPHTLGALCDLAGGAHLERLWLLHAPPRSDHVAHALDWRTSRTATVTDVPQPVAGPTANCGSASAELPAVPRVEFTTFWAASQTHLTGTQLHRVRDRLAATIRTCDTALTRRRATDHLADIVADLAFGILNQAPSDDQLAIDIRALQLAAWEHDLYVKVQHTQLHQHEERPRRAQVDVDTTMLAYRQPYRALTAALTRRGYGVADLTTIRLDDTDPTAGTIRCLETTVSLTPAAATSLRAQLHLRRADGAGDDEQLLPHTPKALAKALTDAQTDLGIHVHGRRAERTRDHTTRALRQLGITLHTLP